MAYDRILLNIENKDSKYDIKIGNSNEIVDRIKKAEKKIKIYTSYMSKNALDELPFYNEKINIKILYIDNITKKQDKDINNFKKGTKEVFEKLNKITIKDEYYDKLNDKNSKIDKTKKIKKYFLRLLLVLFITYLFYSIKVNREMIKYFLYVILLYYFSKKIVLNVLNKKIENIERDFEKYLYEYKFVNIESIKENKVMLLTSNFYHFKLFIIDDVAILGSTNFTYKGLNTNIESMIIIKEENDVQTLEKFFDDFYEKHSYKTSFTIKKLYTPRELLEKGTRNYVT